MLGQVGDQEIIDFDVSISPDKYLAQHYPNVKIKKEPISPIHSHIQRDQVSPDRILTRINISQANVKSEASFDSGYYSPVSKRSKMDDFPSLIPTLQMSPFKIEQDMTLPKDGIMEEMCNQPLYNDENLSGGWESDFFSNFEESFLNMDFDEHTLDGILKSPKGKVVLNEMLNSPKGKAIMQSPKGKIIKDKLKHIDLAGKTDMQIGGQCIKVLAASDPNKMSATPFKQDLNAAQKMSKRRLALSAKSDSKENSTKLTISRNLYIRHKQEQHFEELDSPDLKPQEVEWPETERLKFARDRFKLTLDRAVQNMSRQQMSNDDKCQAKRKVRGKSSKYPELSQALARPSSQSELQPFGVKNRRNTSLSFVPLSTYVDSDEDDEDEDWEGSIPFAPSPRKRKRKSKAPSRVVSKKCKK